MVATHQPPDEREELRRWIDELPAEDLPQAKALLARMRLERSLAEAPEVEPEPGELEAIREAREEDAAHPEERRSLDEVRRELGL